MKRIVFALLFLSALILSPSPASAGTWDILENWDTWTYQTKIQGVVAPNEGTWGNYCSYTGGNGATVWSSYAYRTYNAMIGTYSYSATGSSYLNYKFPSPTPSANNIKFYYYSYMVVSYFQCYNSSGSLLAQYTISSSSSSSYSGWMTQSVPAGTAELRWYVSSKYSTSYSYSLYVDEITFQFLNTWDIMENWDGWSYGSSIYGNRAPNAGTWGRYCSSSVSNGGTTVWSSYTYSGYNAMIGTYSSSAYASSYLSYRFTSPTPSATTIQFYYYSYRVISYFQCYNSSGSLISQTTISSSSSSTYSGWANYSVPANTMEIRWYVSSKYSSSYSYALYVDEITMRVLDKWDIYENWNTRSNGATINGSIPPNQGTWSRYCSYTSASNGGATSWSTSYGYGGSITAMIGPYSTSTTCTSYLAYNFPSATPRTAYIQFYWYAYYVLGYFQCYNSSGQMTAQYQLTTSNSGSYQGWGNCKVPAGTKQIRWYVGSMYSSSYSYALYVDEIRFALPLVSIENIGGATTGFDAPNAGLVQLTVDITIDSTASFSNQYTDFYYRNEAGKDFLLGTDYTTGDGTRSTIWNTGSLIEFGGSIIVKFNAYDTKTSSWRSFNDSLENVFIYNPILTSFLDVPPVIGGLVRLGASFDKGPDISGSFPPNPWTMTSSGYYSSGWYTFVNNGYTTPRSATYTSYNSYFNYVPSTSGQHRIKLMTGSGTTYTIIANGPVINSAVGTQTYSLENVTGFTNVPAGVMIGMSHKYTGTYRPTGNPTPSTYYLASGDLSGTVSLSSSNTSYGVPLSLNYNMNYPETPKIEFGFSANRVDVSSIGVANAVSGASSTEWNSEPFGNAYVYAAARAFNGTMWSGWHFSTEPINIVNRIEAEFDTSMGDGVLIYDGATTPVSFTKTLTVSWSDIFTYKVEAPDIQLEVVGDNRWRFVSWSNGGGRSQDLMVPSEYAINGITPRFVANYNRQYYFTYDSPIEPFSITEANTYYDEGVTISGSVPQIIPDPAQPLKYRKYCTGWSESGGGLSGTRNETTFHLSGRTHLAFHYRDEMSVIIHNDRGASTGTLGGFYPLNTPITLSVHQSVDDGQSRLACKGYNLVPGGASTSYTTGAFNLIQPIEITWDWDAQHYVNLSATMGTVTLVGGGTATGWHNEGSVLNVIANKPIEPPLTQYRLSSWNGLSVEPLETITITVNQPINAVAQWDTYYQLSLNYTQGSVKDDPSGYLLGGSKVSIEAIPPETIVGERYIIEWSGDEPAVNMGKDPLNPHLVSLNMTKPVTQNIIWHRQVVLIITNPNAFAEVVPSPGYNWYDPGTVVSGYAEFSTDFYICDGFRASGSVASSDQPFFSFAIFSPTSIEWLWTNRTDVPDVFWQLPKTVDTDAQFTSAALKSDGTRVVTYYSPSNNSIYISRGNGDIWTKSRVAEGITALNSLDIAITADGNEYIVAGDSATHTLYLFTPASNAAGVNGWAMRIVDDLGDVGRSAEIAINPNDGTIYVGYLDSSSGKMKVAHIQGDIITIEVVPTEGVAAMFCSISVKGIDGLPVVAFYESSTRSLVVSNRINDGWVTEVVDRTGSAGYFCKIKATLSGGMMVAYQDTFVTNNPVVKFARKTAEAWAIETVDSHPSGYFLDFELDSMHNAHIVSSNGGRLRYVRRTADLWETMTIPKPNGIDGWLSLFVLPNGKAGVFYTQGEKVGYLDATATKLINVDDGVDPTPGDDDDDDDNGTGAAGGGGGCFVATAAFGAISEQAVVTLSAFRDAELSFSASSFALVTLYYEISPSLAEDLSASCASRALIRSVLRP